MKRTLTLGAAWLASAAGAVGLGFLAVSLVDASASPGTSPVAASTSATAEPSEGTPEPTTASPRVTGEFATVAGTVYANCTSGRPVLAGVPTAGWWVDDSNEAGQVEFENGTQRLEVSVTCAGTTPQFSVEGPRADDSGGQDGPATPRSSAPSSPSATDDSGRDDSSGRGGGGHGSDDGSGDDSSGRGGGGHGSDD
jgi:hypothetical protein